MRVLVTGAAGFIGSHLCEAFLGNGHSVIGVDRFADYYPREQKLANIARSAAAGLDLHEIDLALDDLDPLLDGIDQVHHLAAQAGVRNSWGDEFATYANDNVLATQRLLEASRRSGVKKVIYASSSSVYGNQRSYPVCETATTEPFSPYGVTKLAAEHLCKLYAQNFDLNTVSLRYFTVYGPRQRPDMAFTRLIRSALGGAAFPLYGDGSHVRQFTYVGDIVNANLAAGKKPTAPGEAINVCGGSEVSLAETIELIADLTGTSPTLARQEERAGDVKRTGGDGSRAEEVLGWKPEVDLAEGIRKQVEWLQAMNSM